MKKKNLSAKLSLDKNVISSLNDVKGGEVPGGSGLTPCTTTVTKMNCLSQIVVCGTGSMCVPVGTWAKCYDGSM